ncbi:MAG: DNA-3-methyladenine glycosylase 2 family protein [Actinomycetota bacterium]|nr:DNA-3-methyladenine glycosylase 2 family protein [Actinomycetota bacterium]
MPAGATRTAWRAAALELAATDPVMARLHDRHGPPIPRRGALPARRFEALASSIAYQQLAGRAAATIWARVLDAVGDPFTPEAVLATDPDALRGAGLSGSKTAALLDLAAKSSDGTLRLDRIARLSDAEVIDHLTVVRGIGPWTAQMFLMFDLRRLDVWPTGDYGVRAGFARAFGLDTMPTEKELAALGAPFAPYRSVVAWWCWREVDTVLPAP